MINQLKQIRFTISLGNQLYNQSYSIDSTIGEVKNLIYAKLDIKPQHYSLFYKTFHFKLGDNRPLYSIFGNDDNPSLILLKKDVKIERKYSMKSTKLQKNQKEIIVKSSLNTIDFNDYVFWFFKGMKLPYNAIITKKETNLYEITFQNSEIAREFFNYRKTDEKLSSLANTSSTQLHLPSIEKSRKKMRISSSVEIIKHKTNQQKRDKPKKSYSIYLSSVEKYIKEKYEDKKNWLNQKGFIRSVGLYSMKPSFIPNYVGLSQSEPPVNHQFRDVNKTKWINKKGFFLV